MFFAIARRKRYLGRFIRADATEPMKARSLPELGLPETKVFRRLRRSGAIQEATPGRFYIPKGLAEALAKNQHRIAYTALIAVILLLMIAFVLSVLGRQ